MLAEKFFLVLETLNSHVSDGSARVVSTASLVPVKVLPPTARSGNGPAEEGSDEAANPERLMLPR